MSSLRIASVGFRTAFALLMLVCGAAHAEPQWEPTAPVELVVPASAGGGADQMARFIQEAVTKHGLMKQPLSVINKPANSGVEGLLEVKGAKGNPHKLIITLSNLFTAPMATGADVTWRDLTPVQLLALDQFVLWVNAASPYMTTKELIDAVRNGPRGQFKLGGTGSKQEDQLISVLFETAVDSRLTYVPLKGGGDVVKALAAREVDITVNNPIEAAKQWTEGKVRPLCVFDGVRLDYATKIANNQSWSDIPTCMSFGVPVQYLMMRGIFMAPGVAPDQVAYYNQVLDRVRALPEWKDFMARGAFKTTEMTGEPFASWLGRTESFHRVLMREARLLHGMSPLVAVNANSPLQFDPPAAGGKSAAKR
jgi:putative tricarboxylic transport membrane protein